MPTPERALSIGAHPDDAEFAAGGLLGRWAQEGCLVTILVVTDGSKGTWNEALSPEVLVAQRQAEQRAAAQVLGAVDVVMLDHVDGELEYSMRLREEFCYWIRTVRPQVVFTHDPWRKYQLHPDHRVTGEAALDAVVAARDHLFFPDQLKSELTKHRPDWILLWGAEEPNHWEDIASTYERKVDALMQHSSQTRSTLGKDVESDEARIELEAGLRRWTAEVGEHVGLDLAEAFRKLKP